jgi:hypothetical protein
MPRFVLLRHECPPTMGKPSHWDFMLEQGDALLTWSLAELPAPWHEAAGKSQPPAGTAAAILAVEATKLAVHRLAYLDYEGPVSDGRGEVTRCDGGDYRLLEASEARVCVELAGRQIRGRITLDRTSGDRWRLQVADGP